MTARLTLTGSTPTHCTRTQRRVCPSPTSASTARGRSKTAHPATTDSRRIGRGTAIRAGPLATRRQPSASRATYSKGFAAARRRASRWTMLVKAGGSIRIRDASVGSLDMRSPAILECEQEKITDLPVNQPIGGRRYNHAYSARPWRALPGGGAVPACSRCPPSSERAPRCPSKCDAPAWASASYRISSTSIAVI